jgi:hypothetical protein
MDLSEISTCFLAQASAELPAAVGRAVVVFRGSREARRTGV